MSLASRRILFQAPQKHGSKSRGQRVSDTPLDLSRKVLCNELDSKPAVSDELVGRYTTCLLLDKDLLRTSS